MDPVFRVFPWSAQQKGSAPISGGVDVVALEHPRQGPLGTGAWSVGPPSLEVLSQQCHLHPSCELNILRLIRAIGACHGVGVWYAFGVNELRCQCFDMACGHLPHVHRVRPTYHHAGACARLITCQ